MPTRRIPINASRRHRISERAVELFVEADALRECGDDERWEEDGGRREHYLELKRLLYFELGSQPHQTSPLDVDSDCELHRDDKLSTREARLWQLTAQAVRLRRQLEAAAHLAEPE